MNHIRNHQVFDLLMAEKSMMIFTLNYESDKHKLG